MRRPRPAKPARTPELRRIRSLELDFEACPHPATCAVRDSKAFDLHAVIASDLLRSQSLAVRHAAAPHSSSRPYLGPLSMTAGISRRPETLIIAL
jgi:hypothetical protein